MCRSGQSERQAIKVGLVNANASTAVCYVTATFERARHSKWPADKIRAHKVAVTPHRPFAPPVTNPSSNTASRVRVFVIVCVWL